ncbi:MAG: hypothetical protein ACPGTR_00875 [Opitutales bacterium]
MRAFVRCTWGRLPTLRCGVCVFGALIAGSWLTDARAAAVNQLLRSGSLAELQGTPIYSNEGILFTIGALDGAAFDVTDRLQGALAAAEAAGGVVKAGWTTETEFQEWTDRLILKKTTDFYVLNGSAFYQNYFIGAVGFTADKLTSVDPNPLPDLDVLVQNYIDAGEHLNLYPEAQDAGNQGAAALIEELSQDRGPVTLVETIEFSRVVETLDPWLAPHELVVLENEPVVGKELALPPGAALKDTRLDSFEAGANFSEGTSGVATYSQKMLNGFTVGNEWSKGITYDRRWFYAHTSAFAGFGLGLRIPWTADVEVSKRVISADEPDQTSYDAAISVKTEDGDQEFYRSAGMPAHHRYYGREMPLEAGAGIALEIQVLGVWAINRGRDFPVVGKVIDMGQDFDPPLGDAPMNIATLELPYELSELAYLTPLAGVGGDFKADIGVRGDAIELKVSPHNSWNVVGSGLSNRPRSIRLTDEETPISLPFAINDDAAAAGQARYHFGPIYDQASYQTSLTITPQARIRGTLFLSELWSALSDVTITSTWHPLFTASFELPSLGPHAGIESRIQATHQNTRQLPAAAAVTPERLAESGSAGVWDFSIGNLGSDAVTLVEYIPDGVDLDVGSITSEGVYNGLERTITWTLKEGSVPEKVAYRVTADSATAVPRPAGAVESATTNQRAVRDARYASLREAEAELDRRELSLRPTLQEVRDLRTGSELLAVSDGSATLRLKLQQSEDLADWQNLSEATVQVDADAPIRFYRYVPGPAD